MKLGIIGAGAVARRGHLPAYRNIPAVEVVGIADVNEPLVKRVAKEFQIPRYYTRCEELLQDGSIEIVDICTPTQTHLEMVEMTASRGKHVLVEKPLASSLKDALRIRKVVAENDTKLCVVQNWRYFPSVIATRERILNGYLGKIVSIHGLGLTSFPTQWTLSTWLYHHGGALYDFGPHVVDMILFMKDFCPIRKVYASGGDFSQGNMDFINYAVINMEFEDGTIATADISWVTAMKLVFTLDIHGTGGSLFLDVRNDVTSETRLFTTPVDDVRFFLTKIWKVGTGVLTGKYFEGANAGYKPLITGFMDSIKGDGKIPVPVEQAIMTNAVLEAAALSIHQNKPIYIDEIMNI